MTKTRVEVITSVQRRRRWPRAEKERIVAAAMEPGAVASEVARSAGIQPVVPMAARALRCAGVFAGGGCAWAGGDARADGAGGRRDRVCERSADAAQGAGRGFDRQGAGLVRIRHQFVRVR
jgi:hypothetical protein